MSNIRHIRPFNSEQDFQRFWSKRGNYEPQCFKDCIDDITSGSFVLKSFRNEYENDNFIDEESFKLLKSGAINLDTLEEDIKNIPPEKRRASQYKIESFLPACSQLTRPEMTHCFKMYRELCIHKQLDEKMLDIYTQYNDIILDEQKKYLEIAENTWDTSNYVRLDKIKQEIHDYTTELWKKRLERVSWYPKNYSKFSDISLIDDSGKKSELSLLKRLLFLGTYPYCFIPNLGSKALNIFDDVSPNDENISENPQYYKKLNNVLIHQNYHPDISKDGNAEYWALHTTAKVVMSTSGFLSLFDNGHSNFTNSWELPIVVKEVKDGDTQKKVVFIDKTFPPSALSANKRIKWYCKKHVCQLLQTAKNNEKKNAEKKNKSFFDDYDCHFSEDDISKLETFGIDSYQPSVDDRPNTRSRSRSRSRTRSRSPVNTRSRTKSASSGTDLSDSGSHKSPRPFRLNASNNSKEDSSFSNSENELTIDMGYESPDVVTTKKSDEKINSKRNGNNKEPNENKPKKSLKSKKPTKNTNESSKVIYQLWSLKCDTTNVLLKSNVKDIDIIIRSKAGIRVPGGAVYHLSPKLEYQPEFGAETTTISELTRDWANSLIRPNSYLLRVRLDAISGDLIMYEKKLLKDLTIDFNKNHSKNPYDKLISFHNVLGQLTELPLGNYILSHSPSDGNFALLYKESTGKSTYNSNLKYLTIDPHGLTSSKRGWLPIDKMVITPMNAYYFRIPATFYPKVSKCSSKLEAVSREKLKQMNEKKGMMKMKQRKKRNQKKNEARKKKNAAKNAKVFSDKDAQESDALLE